MLIKGIDFQQELLRAQSAGNLAIFAGAGVSNPKPSGLPLFNQLADQIGARSGVGRERFGSGAQETDDRYLGRLQKRALKVHQSAAKILIGPHTTHHELHQLLLKVFPSAKAVRLVTTNFDEHFTTAACTVFDSPVETFFAPALPLGDDFTGLVYLHGSAAKDPMRCVLTDEDFGRAYLTQAWASRFLAAMFSKYVVLFVGYSHDDTVMNYLARGLPPSDGKRRFVLTAEDNLAKWEFLGIHPMVYKLVEADNAHQAIKDSIGCWVAELRSGLLDKAQRIRVIAESQPPLEGEDADYIRYALTEIDTARIFLKHARLPEWIGWLEKHGFIQPVFNRHAPLDQFGRELAHWLTEHFCVEHAHALWAAIQRNGGRLNPHVCWCIWRRLQMRDRDASVGGVFSRWIGVLLMQPYDILCPDDWAALLNACCFPADKLVSVLLLDHVTKPRISLKERWRFFSENDEGGGKVEFGLNLLDDGEHWVSEAWTQLFQPNMAAYAALLEPVVTANISAAHALSSLERETCDDYDPFYFHRQSIEAHEQDRHPKTIDVLVDAAREILKHRLQEKPQAATALIASWFGSGIPMLRRLAVFGLARHGNVSPDEKLRWLLSNRLLYRFKPDVFGFLRQCYPPASETARRELVECAMQGPSGAHFDHLEARARAYETFNLFVWLQRIAPDCQLVVKALGQLQIQNPEFAPRPCPDVDFWSSRVGTIEPTRGFNVEEILAKPPAVFLDELLAARPATRFDKSRSDYCAVASTAAAKQPKWGIEWICNLVSRGLPDADLWAPVCQGWRNADLKPEDWRSVLDLAEVVVAPATFFEAFAEVLEHGARREKHAIPDDLMPLAQRVAERVWKLALESAPLPLENAMHRDWLATAINHPGGKLAEFWLRRVSVARREAGDSWKGIPHDIADSLKTIVRGTSGAAAHARVVITSQLHYFFSLDADFAQAELLPLFDWHADATKAEQCWHGFLYWGRWLPGFTEPLLLHFKETVARVEHLPKEIREAMVNHIAALALFRVENPLANEWFTATVQKLAEPELEGLASTMGRFLDEVDAETGERVWTRWLKDYWNLRLLGIPKPLIRKEANEMACWSLSVGRYFPEAVKLVAAMGNTLSFEHSGLIRRIDKKGLAKSHPEDAADLVLLYLRCPRDFFFPDEHVTNVWRDLRLHGVQKEKLMKIREEMFRLGHDPGEP